ncbi:pentapeptide repeat-containing protein [Nonomuraea wenchangensis]
MVALVTAAGLVWAALVWLAIPNSAGQPATVTNLLEVIKISLSVVAGIGGVVALVVAYRKQRLTENGEKREQAKLYIERFDKATDKLGNNSPAVRLAGIHALAALADDWEEERQMCIDVLCAYVRLPAEPEPDDEDDPAAQAAWKGMAEVHATAVREIASRLRTDASTPWHGYNFDFTGAAFHSGPDFDGAVFSNGRFLFEGAEFAGGEVFFRKAQFSGALVSFAGARCTRADFFFDGAKFSAGEVLFTHFERMPQIFFSEAEFSGGEVSFAASNFSRGGLNFNRAKFSGGKFCLEYADFSHNDRHTLDFSKVASWDVPPLLPQNSRLRVILPPQARTPREKPDDLNN